MSIWNSNTFAPLKYFVYISHIDSIKGNKKRMFKWSTYQCEDIDSFDKISEREKNQSNKNTPIDLKAIRTAWSCNSRKEKMQ